MAKKDLTADQIRAFKKLFRDARQAKGWNQTEVADKLLERFGWVVSQTYISGVEIAPPNNMRMMDVLMLAALYEIEPNRISEVLGFRVPSRLDTAIRSLTPDMYDQVAEAIEKGLSGEAEWVNVKTNPPTSMKR